CEVKIWEVATGREVCALQGRLGVVRALMFSPDGQQLVTTSFESDRTDVPRKTGEVRFWDAATGRLVRTFQVSSAGVLNNAAFSPDGRLLAWAAGATGNGVGNAVFVWEVSTGQQLLTLKTHSQLPMRMAFSPDGQRLATPGRDGIVGVWDVSTDRKG